MKPIGECSILRMKPKKNIEYPLIRLPKEYKHLIGKRASIYELDRNKFLIFVDDSADNRLYNRLYNHDFSNGVAVHHNHKLRTRQISEEEEREIMLRPGFEPGSSARKAGMIGRATPPEHYKL